MKNKIFWGFIILLVSSFLFSGNLFAKDPDLGMYGFLKIGKFKKEVKWNKTIVLTPADVTSMSNGKPAFEVYYAYREYAGVSAKGFKNKVFFNGKLVSLQTNLSLNPKQIKQVHTQAYLGPKNGKLQIKIDADNEVKESREDNNFHFYVNIVFRGFNVASKFRVTRVHATVFPTKFAGKCPKKFEFKGHIIVNGPGVVKYQWKRKDGAIAPVKTLIAKKAGTYTVTTSWTLGGAGKVYNNYWEALAILAPNKMMSNKAVFSLKCTGGNTQQKLPDLIVRDIKLVQGCKIAVTLKNIGNAGVPASSYVLPKAVGVQMYKDGKAWGGLILKGVDPNGKLRSPGGSVTYIWFPGAKNLKLGPGTHSIKVIVDNNKFLFESNENNNALVRRLKCTGGETGGSPERKLPDLIVRDIKLIQGCKIAVTIKNIGNAGVPASSYVLPKAVGVQMYKDSKPWGGLILKGVDPNGKLKSPGGSVTYIWFPGAQNLKLGPGTHSIKVIVDNNKFLFESNENNNALVRRLKCPGVTEEKVSVPKRFMLNFVDAYLVYVPSSKKLQITTENMVLSYGSDWQVKKIGRQYLYHLKQNFWKGFYWQINTIRKEAYLVKGNNFGRIGDSGKEKINNITVDVVGGSARVAPTRFLLRFKSAHLVYAPSSKTLQIIAENKVLSYGSDWKKCNLKPYLYQLQQNVWKGFHWQINTSRKIAQKKTGGKFCKIGGSATNLRMTVKVIN